MQLQQEQIQYLDNFCQKKGIRYYDLRMEVVDHLTAGIEEKMNNDSKLSFGEALTQAYKGFGVTGFSKVIQERERSIRKTAGKLEWALFKSFFTFPKLFVTLLIYLFFLYSILIVPPQHLKTFLRILAIIYVSIGFGFGIFHLVKFKAPKEKLLSLNLNWGSFFASFCLFAFLIYDSLSSHAKSGVAGSVYFKCLACTIMIITSIAKYKSYKFIHFSARKNYPLAFQ